MRLQQLALTAGFAVSTFTSQNYGGRKYARIREGVRVGLIIGLVSYVLCGAIMVCMPETLPMCSGILEMLLRVLIIVLFLPRISFQATAYAEVAVWAGALALNIAAYSSIGLFTQKQHMQRIHHQQK